MLTSCSRWGLENAFFSATFVPNSGGPASDFLETTRIEPFRIFSLKRRTQLHRQSRERAIEPFRYIHMQFSNHSDSFLPTRPIMRPMRNPGLLPFVVSESEAGRVVMFVADNGMLE